MGVFDLLLEFLSRLVGGFTKHSNRPFEFPSRHLFIVDIVLFQESIKVRYLCDHTNRSDNGKGRGEYSITHAGHEVTAAGCDFVDRDSELDFLFANS